MRASLRKRLAILAIAAPVQGWLFVTAMALHLAQHDPDALLHDQRAAIGIILHGHYHQSGTPEHHHAFVTAKPLPQHLKRLDLPNPPQAAAWAILSSAPSFPRSFRCEPEIIGPSPPSLIRMIAVLRI